MKKYIGMNFKKWCALDVFDTRKINYTCEFIDKTINITSEEEVSPYMMDSVREATIEDIKMENEEWFIKLKINRDLGVDNY